MKDIFKEFKPSSWAIDNKTSIFVLTVIITLAGIMSFNNLPKEKFPDIAIPTIFVQTIYPGTSPADMENLVTRHIEKEIKAISGVKKVTSHSLQDYSTIIVEFNTDVSVDDARQKVKDAVDKSKSELPSDLPNPPLVNDFNFADMPILFVNLSGDFDLSRLKKYADALKDKIESMPEITRVDEVGAQTREIQVNVDMYKMQAAKVTMGDIERAVSSENLVISGGIVTMGSKQRSLSVSGQFTNMDQIRNLIIRSMGGATLYLKDIASVKDTAADADSYARLNGKNVISLNIVKRSGANLIDASDKVRSLVKEMQANTFPPNLHITLTGDQSDQTRHTLHDLINTIIIGFILVTIILMFFMGATNALFVGLSVPLSMFVAFLVLPGMDYSLNMIVLFAFLLGLGIVVDDAIVVIENTHRIFDNGKMNIVQAAKAAAGEVFLPVLSGTLTTLAPFIPLAFWGGIIGKFMHYMPVTLIITLTASLFVAYIINPVFAVTFMKPHKEGHEKERARWTRGTTIISIIFISVALLSYLGKNFGMGNFAITLLLIHLLYKYVLVKAVNGFQNNIWPRFQARYTRFLKRCVRHPYLTMSSVVGVFIFSIILFAYRTPNVVFFPKGDPNFIYVYLNLPVGTDVKYTDSVTQLLEGRVYKVLGKNNPMVQSVITNVAIGATDPSDNDQGTYPNKSKIGVAFVDYSERHGVSTRIYLDSIQHAVQGIAGAEISVDQERAGPPTGKPVNIEIKGDDYKVLATASQNLLHYLDSMDIPGVEELKSDLQKNKPEIVFDIDRERANFQGVSTGQIGQEIRTAVYGYEASKYRDLNDEYPIMVRYRKSQRENINELRNLDITFRDMNMHGEIRQIPISTFANIHYGRTYGAITRLNEKPVITLSSNVLGGYNSNQVVAQVSSAIRNFQKPRGVDIELTGEQQDQKETSTFLGHAFLTAIGLIFMILITQFNSISKPFIILSEVIFCIVGILLGFSITKMDMSIVMCGVGFVALAGLVVRNGILLVEFTDLLVGQGYSVADAVVEGGRIRMTPVLLTAIATILGLIPLAVGLNIDFVTMFSELNPHIFFGGDSVAFWGPLSWTMIFGLSFATFLTLIVVPVMYSIADKVKRKLKRITGGGMNKSIVPATEHVVLN
ncbi:MAG: efflux RND transporter permease subunit [Bacteroidia bacterium]|nr:efflux RND transporter permease subunit [Bacteroidia bacterium]